MLKRILKKKKIIFVEGDYRRETARFVDFILRDKFSIFYTKKIPNILNIFSILKSDIIIFEDSGHDGTTKIKKFLFSLQTFVFVATEAKKKTRVKKFLRGEIENTTLVLDFSLAKKIRRKKVKEVLTFGIERKKADFYITDINIRKDETNFKVNYGSNSIPFWVNKGLKRKEIYAVLPALSLAKPFNINLVEISSIIKEKLVSFTWR
jgi:hypothetical protein